ncbi:MAG: helix-turn-helix transcriptional regulator [Proteobacteria bacterium]|nr:helix-turn-helix transcriptional regulator [Pseudomonadota bacterium]
MPFNLERLRNTRKSSGLPLKEIAARMGISVPQVQRLENGQRRMTVDALERYCAAVGLDVADVIRIAPIVPIIGIVDSNHVVHPLTPNTPYETRAPYIVPDPEHLAAIRYEPKGQIAPMLGHLLFFYANTKGIPGNAWNNRCLLRHTDKSERMGWPIKRDGQIHINDVMGDAEFNVEIEWASPILAVIPPFLLA